MADTTAVLNFSYFRNSTLPRREFLVDASVWTGDTETDVQYAVTAPDRLEALRLVRRDLTRKDSVTSFRMEMVREVAERYATGGPSEFLRRVPTVVEVWDRNL